MGRHSQPDHGLVVPPLVPVFGVYLAGRIFIGATLLLMLLGPMALQRAVYGRWSAWPLVGGIFVYNGFSSVGLMNICSVSVSRSSALPHG